MNKNIQYSILRKRYANKINFHHNKKKIIKIRYQVNMFNLGSSK